VTSRRRRAPWAVVALLAVGATVAACGDAADPGPTPTPDATSSSPELPTLVATPLPEEPLTGELYADMRQSSIDARLGQMQVWVRNDTAETVPVTTVRYRDDRLPEPLPGGRPREIPSRGERGYPLVLPARPDCTSGRGGGEDGEVGTVEVVTSSGTTRVPVADEADVVARFVQARCAELAVAQVATLSWSDEVPVEGAGSSSSAELVLVVRPTGATGRRLVIDSVDGTYLLQSAGRPWAPATTVAATGGTLRVRLPLRPARCDPHAFAEGGGATAFRVHYRLDGEAGVVVLRMGEAGAAAAYAFARDYCGL
jgi:hypothetical protein